MARKYQHTMKLLPQIEEMLNSGMTQKEVEEALGLTGVRPIHHLLTRERKKQVQGIAKPRGRKPAKTLQEYKYENKRLRMENELLRDFLSLTEKEVKPSVKYLVIYRHSEKYAISEMCRLFGVSRSGYYDFVSRMDKAEKDIGLAERVRECQEKCHYTYGYRRVHIWLERNGIHRNPKTVLRIMQKYSLLVFRKPLARRVVQKKPYGDNAKRKTPFVIIKVRSSNCTRKQREVIQNE